MWKKKVGEDQKEIGRHSAAGFEDGGARSRECGQHLEAGKGKEMVSPLQPLEGTQLCRSLDFSLGRPISDV